ncbi:hydroxyacylglutathione hydrolase [Chelatococcus composti]|uniref:Hydroxyacylglutathione hydrolase n=1 Tax=Chelatococcus composti TaxID=1743235 RepID=A0A841KBS7_9HYPH|nr:hydroxyacylglutathione hydrolase [Chelatococcus composti]MBB6167456.1 hydroxyacylglutathione hydrolase [Chelatococcus composti]MBS7735661.1 hydroxyacylglutathione hydrolase [Chelatococcus composti]PZN46220.1 MAG: hydroxyacylglutathione hydrolase [Pseudomonadota bacterium]GGG32077.1 hydroxyacylglutathione hydrolase [Chelatococcus composti]
MPADIHVFPCRSDNIGVLIRDAATGACAAIDAPEEQAVRRALAETGWHLTHILVTHKHHDHVEGIPGLKRETGATVIGPAAEAAAIPGIDRTVLEGDEVAVGDLRGKVIATPGHTLGHVAYWFAGERALFAGDTLFALGCGRLFEGTPADMWGALGKLSALPDDTRLYCGHEYTLSNARFALAADPGNVALARRAAAIEAARARGELTIPSLLGEEKATNPFLRAGEPALAAAVNLSGRPAVEVFAALRAWKDRF